MAFGETLSNLRRARGLSQEQLAEALDLTRQTISKWELNQSTPDIEYVLKLSVFFGVSTDYLIKNEDTASNNEHLINTGAETEAEIFVLRNKALSYKWCFYFGLVFAAISLIGIIAFVIFSAQHPWGALVNGMYFEGLIACLIGTSTLWFFAILVILLTLGVFLSFFGMIKYTKALNKN